MSIYFRSRKYPDFTFDCSFEVKDGADFIDMERYLVGDLVNLSIDPSDVIGSAVADMPESWELLCSRQMSLDKSYHIYIQLRVVERRHYLWFNQKNDRLALKHGGTYITCEAINGYNEDVFRWFFLGEIPLWGKEYIRHSNDASASSTPNPPAPKTPAAMDCRRPSE